MDQKRRLTWFVLVRVVVVSLFLISTIILNIKEPDVIGEVTLTGFIKLIVATYLFSIISVLCLKGTERHLGVLANAQIVWDLFLVTLLILLTGGISSPFSFLYIISIISASFLLARRQAIYTASLCCIMYGAIIDLQYYGRLLQLGLSPLPPQHGAGQILYVLFVNIIVFYLVAFITGYLAERAILSETALHQKVINYEELERLNSLIVSNLASGLITTTIEGHVRVFNQYAAESFGLSLEEAYDRPLEEVVPSLSPVIENISIPHCGEIEHTLRGRSRTFGYKSIPFTDKEGGRVGVLVELQDLTQLKRMEMHLKKVDRLAAVGELSARLAHEIRNPLASISGSVQLIGQGEIPEKDKALLQIVLRETDRLNGLISDFLAYARPSRPNKVQVKLHQLIEDLASLLTSDSRFRKVSIANESPLDLAVMVDRGQFQQVLWNLAVNAAEAMPEGGSVSFSAGIVGSELTGADLEDFVNIKVADDGIGMEKDDMSNIFEPFFTTKPGGTGLGLATVYRIVESHGGVVLVDSKAGEGSVFTIAVPAGLG